MGLPGKAGKAAGVAHREIGQHLAVDLDARGLEAVHQAAVGHPLGARRGVDPLDPERAEFALAVAPVAILVLQPLLDPGQRQPEAAVVAAPVTARLLQHLLVPGLGGDPALDPCHRSRSRTRPPKGGLYSILAACGSIISAAVGQHPLDHRDVDLGEQGAAAVPPLRLRRLVGKIVAVKRVVALHLAAAGEAEALGSAALGLEFRHGNPACRAPTTHPPVSGGQPQSPRLITKPPTKRNRSGGTPRFHVRSNAVPPVEADMSKPTLITTTALVALLVAPALAQQQQQAATQQPTGQSGFIAQQQDDQVRADELFDTGVTNGAGEELGDVEDLLLTRDGQVAGAIVGVGGFLGLGEKQIAVPWQELQIQRADGPGAEITMLLERSREQLEQAPGFQDLHDLRMREEAEAAQQQMIPTDSAGGDLFQTDTTTPAVEEPVGTDGQ